MNVLSLLALLAAAPAAEQALAAREAPVKDAVARRAAGRRRRGRPRRPRAGRRARCRSPRTPSRGGAPTTSREIQECYEETLAAKDKAVEGKLHDLLHHHAEGLVKKRQGGEEGHHAEGPEAPRLRGGGALGDDVPQAAGQARTTRSSTRSTSRPSSRTPRVDLELTETQTLIRDTARKFARERVAPQARELDREELFPAELYTELAELGLLGVNIPAAATAAPRPAWSPTALAMMEIAAACASTSVAMAVTNMCARADHTPSAPRRSSEKFVTAADLGRGGGRARSRSPSRTRAPIPARCAPPRCARATAGCSTAASSGSPRARTRA